MKKKYVIITGGFLLTFLSHAFYMIKSNISLAQKWNYSHSTNYFLQYFKNLDFLLGLSYALAIGFTIFTFLNFFEARKTGSKGFLSSLTITGLLYFGGCFLIGCCGSPMLVVYLSLFGSAILGFTKLIVFVVTVLSIALSYFWLERRNKKNELCCTDNNCCNDKNTIKIDIPNK